MHGTNIDNATTCPLWTSWSPLPVVAEVKQTSGRDAHEAQLRCPDEVDGDMNTKYQEGP
jgi:hypothetical protein